MKLEEMQGQYIALSKEIIDKQQKRIKLRKKLQLANKKFHETKEATYQPWQFKHLNDELEIMLEEINSLKEQRDLLSREMKTRK